MNKFWGVPLRSKKMTIAMNATAKYFYYYSFFTAKRNSALCCI